MSVAALIRDAIDLVYPSTVDERRSAATLVLDGDPAANWCSDAAALGRAYATLFSPLTQPAAGALASTHGAFRSVDSIRVLDPADATFVASVVDAAG